jgi:predicted nucleic acid-binding protein
MEQRPITLFPRESASKLSRELKPGLSVEEACDDIEALAAWEPAPGGMSLLTRAFAMRRRDQLSWWDSLIVTGAEFAGCDRIPSEDWSRGASYFGIEVENPLVGR